MVLELATPSVQDAGEAGDSAPGLGGDDVTQGVGALLEEGVVKFLGTGEAGLAQLGGQGEGDHEVRGGQ